MDGGAVVALLVVLGDDFPIGGQLVGMAGDDGEVLWAVGLDDGIPTRDVVFEFDVVTAGVDEQPAVPVDQTQFGETELVGVEVLRVAEAGCIAQSAIESVGPRVVWTDDRAALGGRVARQQFVPAVPAGVRERADGVVFAADQQYGVGSRADGLLGADGGEVGSVARA